MHKKIYGVQFLYNPVSNQWCFWGHYDGSADEFYEVLNGRRRDLIETFDSLRDIKRRLKAIARGDPRNSKFRIVELDEKRNIVRIVKEYEIAVKGILHQR